MAEPRNTGQGRALFAALELVDIAEKLHKKSTTNHADYDVGTFDSVLQAATQLGLAR